MPGNKIDANIRCPSCNGQLYPRVLVCDSCGLKVEGEFVMNEFDSLSPDELHFLRVFVQCEGSIRDMEAALGVSYPTVKGLLASIKEKLSLKSPRFAATARKVDGEEGPRAEEAPGTADTDADRVLDQLESGQISYKDAVRLLRSARKRERRNE
ncbi:MAG TPA: DUF2089 family protein [Spirochaetia bacterium]|nr:DUF2089 family protein [Spirochaetia bacterium]